MSAKCTPTETISSTSTLASASDRYASRYTSGPNGVTSASVSRACTSSGGFCGASQIASADAATGSASVRNARIAMRAAERRARRSATRSSSAATPAMHSRNQTVPGTCPAWNNPTVSAPNATYSPCGMKITRVTANSSTIAMANSA